MFKPLFDRVLVKRADELSVTKGGIYIPDTIREKPMQGEVVAVGEDVKKVKIGDRALHAKYSGVDITLDSGKYLLIGEKDVLGLIVPEEEVKMVPWE